MCIRDSPDVSLSTAITLAGTSAIHLQITDDAGNAGTADTTSYVLDTTAPTISFSSVDISADTGSSATDFITKTAAQTLTGTLSAAMEGDDILEVSVNAGSAWSTVTNDVTGTPDVDLSTAITLSGTSAIHLQITDDAGNAGTADTTSYTLDTAAPTLTITIASNNANTAQAKSGDVVTLTLEPSETLQGNPACTIDGEAGTASASGSDHLCTLTLSGDETEGTATFSVTAGGNFADTAGNEGVADTSADTGSVNIDFTAPTISFSSVDISADTGTAADDFNTKTAAQTLTATLSAAMASDDILKVSVDAGSSWSTVTSDVTGSPDVSLSTAITLAGTSAIHLQITDDAGNAGTADTTSYTLDTTAPTLSNIAIASDLSLIHI